MRVGEKCKFVLSENMYALKAGRKYTGIYAGGDRVRYQRFMLVPEEIIPIKKTVVKKEKAPTASDYKNCSDLLFEVGVRYRDNFTSVISGDKFQEGDWNGLQAGHGVSRQHWATRHNPLNCHAITSGQNFHMSLGTTTTIAKYWAYVAKKYGQDVVDNLINGNHPTPKLSISYLKEDCRLCYSFFTRRLEEWNRTHSPRRSADEVIRWRCESFTKKKTDGIMKVLKIVKGEQ